MKRRWELVRSWPYAEGRTIPVVLDMIHGGNERIRDDSNILTQATKRILLLVTEMGKTEKSIAAESSEL